MSSCRMAEIGGHLLARVRLAVFDLLRPLFHMPRHFQEGAGDIIAEAKRYLTNAKCSSRKSFAVSFTLASPAWPWSLSVILRRKWQACNDRSRFRSLAMVS